jgi:hypothetical protein
VRHTDQCYGAGGKGGVTPWSAATVAGSLLDSFVCAELLEDVLLHHELVTSESILEESVRKPIDKLSFPRRIAREVSPVAVADAS